MNRDMEVFTHDTIVWMVLACMMAFVKNQKGDSIKAPEGVCQDIEEYLSYGISQRYKSDWEGSCISTIPVMTRTSQLLKRFRHPVLSLRSSSCCPWSFTTLKEEFFSIYLCCCSTRATLGTRKIMVFPVDVSWEATHLIRRRPMRVFPDPVSIAAITLPKRIE